MSTEETLFIDGAKKYNQRSRGNLTPEEIRGILEIEDGIPLYWIMAESYAITAICLENFLLEHGKVSIDESQKFWDR